VNINRHALLLGKLAALFAMLLLGGCFGAVADYGYPTNPRHSPEYVERGILKGELEMDKLSRCNLLKTTLLAPAPI
jgi:hypothetical protein